ncbi:MAG: hypothetical protein QM722_14120 [Piscinibacter sp.]
MSHRHIRAGLIAAAAALTLSLAGCVVAPAPYYGYGYGGEVVNVAPPAPQVEYYGAPPVVGQIWLGGFWGWHRDRYVWNGGRWATPPGPGQRWNPPEWRRDGPGWRQRPGYWERR